MTILDGEKTGDDMGQHIGLENFSHNLLGAQLAFQMWYPHTAGPMTRVDERCCTNNGNMSPLLPSRTYFCMHVKYVAGGGHTAVCTRLGVLIHINTTRYKLVNFVCVVFINGFKYAFFTDKSY